MYIPSFPTWSLGVREVVGSRPDRGNSMESFSWLYQWLQLVTSGFSVVKSGVMPFYVVKLFYVVKWFYVAEMVVCGPVVLCG